MTGAEREYPRKNRLGRGIFLNLGFRSCWRKCGCSPSHDGEVFCVAWTRAGAESSGKL